MQSLVLEKKLKVSIRDIDIPETLYEDSVRIKPLSVGICGSDVHYFLEGRIGDFVVSNPMVLGHEASGIITEVGSKVSHLTVGDRVCMEPGIPNFMSQQTLAGQYNIDPSVRFWATPPVHGCLRENAVHPAGLTYKLPDSMSNHEGALVEPVSIGVYSAEKAAIAPGDTALIIGSGTIGIVTALAAEAAGCARVILADIKKQKLDFVMKHYGDKISCVDLNTTDIETFLSDNNIPGANIIFEASGSKQVFTELPRHAAPGGKIVLIGMPSEPVSMDVVAMQIKEISMKTIFRYVNTFPRAVNLIASGKLNVKPLVTKSYDFEDSVKAIQYASTQPDSEIKIMIDTGF